MPWYFITVTVYFWLPILALGIWLLPKQDAITLKALALSIVVFWPLTAAMEYLAFTWTSGISPRSSTPCWG